MFSAFTTFSNPFSIPRFIAVGLGVAVDITTVAVHDVELHHDKRARTLKHLLKLNHVNHSIIYHQLQYYNHMPHVCVPALALLQRAHVCHLDISIYLSTRCESTTYKRCVRL